jgi:adenylate cyclase
MRSKGEGGRKAEAAIEKSLSLDPSLAEAHVSRAALLFTPAHGWQYEEVIRECQRALALDPNLAQGHVTLAGLFFHVGLADEALQESRTASSLSPDLTDARLFAAVALFSEGKYDDALSFIRSFGHGAFPTSVQADILWEQGRREEAWGVTRELLKADP